MEQKIKILIVDDHSLFRLGVTTILNNDKSGQFEVVGELEDGNNVVKECIKLQPHIALLDIQLPETDGISIAMEMGKKCPNTKIIALTSDYDQYTIVKMIKTGAKGYILKSEAPKHILDAILDVHKGKNWFSQEVSTALAKVHMKDNKGLHLEGKKDILSKREMEILKLIVEEKSNHEIANQLFLSHRTVETHKRNILIKLKMKNTAGLATYYFLHFK